MTPSYTLYTSSWNVQYLQKFRGAFVKQKLFLRFVRLLWATVYSDGHHSYQEVNLVYKMGPITWFLTNRSFSSVSYAYCGLQFTVMDIIFTRKSIWYTRWGPSRDAWRLTTEMPYTRSSHRLLFPYQSFRGNKLFLGVWPQLAMLSTLSKRHLGRDLPHPSRPALGSTQPPIQCVESSWNVMAHGDTREGKWRGKWRMQWVASTLHTTSEHGVSSINTADAHTSAASSRLNWRAPPI